MKNFLSVIFVLLGITFSNSVFSQDSTAHKKAKKTDSQKTSSKPNPGGDSGGGITIDESGTPKVKKGKTPAAAIPNAPDTATSSPKSNNQPGPQSSSEKVGNSKEDDSPADIAIDEDGSPKTKKNKQATMSEPNTSLSSDSSMIGPASGLERPH